MANRRRAQRGRGGLAVIGVAGAVGASLVAGTQMIGPKRHAPPEVAAVAVVSSADDLCFIGDVRLVEGATQPCVSRADLALWDGRPVLSPDGEATALSLAHPEDALAPVAIVRTCGEFRRLTAEGWYALSSRDMRRQAVFERACGTIAMLRESAPPRSTQFADTGCTQDDMLAVARSTPLLFSETRAAAPADVAVEKAAAGDWRLRGAGEEARILEIAHADFDGDGEGEILAFASLAAPGGTAALGVLGLIRRADPGAPATFEVAD